MDLIDRQQAIDAIEAEKIAHGRYLTSSYVGYEFAEDVLRKLPPVEPVIVPCDYVKACNKATMDKPISAYTYLSVLADLKDHGYVLVDAREVTT